jgi:chromosome segregation ATPase
MDQGGYLLRRDDCHRYGRREDPVNVQAALRPYQERVNQQADRIRELDAEIARLREALREVRSRLAEAQAAIDYEGAKAVSEWAQAVIDEKDAEIARLRDALEQVGGKARLARNICEERHPRIAEGFQIIAEAAGAALNATPQTASEPNDTALLHAAGGRMQDARRAEAVARDTQMLARRGGGA